MPADPSANHPADPYRLPRSVVPSRYDLVLEPDLVTGRFTGLVDIAVSIAEPTDTIVLNSLDLAITAASVDGEGVHTHVDGANERLVLRLDERLAVGPADIHLEFSGELNDKLRGFYRSTYTDDDGTTHVVGTTQMQATDARRAFPCFDEPDFKAVFAITLVVAPGLLAISNGAEAERTTRPDGRVSVRFNPTMAMSTYLVAWVIGRLEATEPVDVDGVPLRVVHVPGKGALTDFAIEVASFSLRWFTNYYGIPYPSDKVDLVALPDFAAGAMENVGCITFREAYLLVDQSQATQSEEQAVADVVSHELAHMWFGDLVTMKWWNGIWLNEAFATFMEVACVDAFRPEWDRWAAFGLERTAAFDVDTLASTRPVEYEVVSPSDADGMFDVLTYQKGGALLRMLEQYLGEERFREGIRLYLRTHAYRNTDTSDLWDAIEAASGEPVRQIMDSWIWQGGYPVITVRPSDSPHELELEQHRFMFDASAVGSELWDVPVLVRQGTTTSRALVSAKSATVTVDDKTTAAITANAGGHGFYRVSYEGGLLDRLTGAALAALTATERYCLVDDAWAFVVAGKLSAADYCGFVRAFADETELAVWQNVLAGLSWCDRFVEGDAREGFRTYVRALVGPAFMRLGWAPGHGERDTTGDLRGALIRALAITGNDSDVIAKARSLNGQEGADPAVLAAALSVVAAFGSDDDYDRSYAAFRATDSPQEQLRYLYALADFPSAELIRRTLDATLGGDVRTQNAPFVIARCLRHRDHGSIAWKFVAEHWDDMTARFPQSSISRMVDGVRTLTTPEDCDAVAAFFETHDIPQAAKTLRQILERQRLNTALRERASIDLARRFG
ncbi:MAG: M1 family metallopeptidase [Acidimicrobiia bacterium]